MQTLRRSTSPPMMPPSSQYPSSPVSTSSPSVPRSPYLSLYPVRSSEGKPRSNRGEKKGGGGGGAGAATTSSQSPPKEPILKNKKSTRSLRFSRDNNKDKDRPSGSSRSVSSPSLHEHPPAFDLQLPPEPPSPSFSFKSLRKRSSRQQPRPSLPEIRRATVDIVSDDDHRPPSVDTTELFAGPRTSFTLDPVDGTVHASNGLSVNTMDALVDQFGGSNSWPRSKSKGRKKKERESSVRSRPSTAASSTSSSSRVAKSSGDVHRSIANANGAGVEPLFLEPSLLSADEASFLSEAVSYGDARDGPSWRPAIPSIDDIVRNHSDKTKPSRHPAQSIDEIIRRHAKTPSRSGAKSAPASIAARGRPSMNGYNASSFSFSDLAAHQEDDEASGVSRSSIDSVAEEIARTITLESETRQRTLRPTQSSRTLPQSRSQPALRRTVTNDSQSSASYNNLRLSPPQSYQDSLASHELEIAQYLRSPRLTRLVTLMRPPNQRLTVSVADVGSPTGHPVIVFLGLGCVRYLVALYDEMAEALGLRLVCLDRWGLGRTGEVPDSKRGFLEWSSVVEEVADILGLGEGFSILAHSAGAPYALASCLRMPDRVRGSVHLLAPWVSTSVEGSGSTYKWLKFVPNGVLRTAQQAEWRMQAWKLGKPPTVPMHGVGYDRKAPIECGGVEYDDDYDEDCASMTTRDERTPTVSLMGGSYDHLDDLDRYTSFDASRETAMGVIRPNGGLKKKKSTSSSFFANLFAGGSPKVSPSPSPTASPSRAPSVRSSKPPPLPSQSSPRRPSLASRAPSVPVSPRSPEAGSTRSFSQPYMTVQREPSVRSWTSTSSRRHVSSPRSSFYSSQSGTTNGTSVLSQSAAAASPTLAVQQLPMSNGTSAAGSGAGNNKLDLGTALLKASHSESLKGATSDLLAILERTNKPWGFSYSDVPMRVKVWHGDRDERISMASVRWMEKSMADCHVRVVEGADHGMMTNTRVVVEALESIAEEAKAWR
jgi:pimeloyl-ACP methyl ester carboxylesterase